MDSGLSLSALSLPSILFSRPVWVIVPAAALLLVLGVFLTLQEKWRKYRSREWPTSVGAITNLQARKVDGGINGVDYWKISFEYVFRVTQEHTGNYSFNCVSEKMANGALAGLTDKVVSVHYKPTDEAKALLWEDEIWDLWWDTYWATIDSP
jgi:hypothetical protein